MTYLIYETRGEKCREVPQGAGESGKFAVNAARNWHWQQRSSFNRANALDCDARAASDPAFEEIDPCLEISPWKKPNYAQPFLQSRTHHLSSVTPKRDFGHDPLLDQTGKRMKWERRLAPKISC
jgi:hypothetical protein